MDISKRLLTVASMVKKTNCMCDIGTDHGYIPIYLCKNNVINKAIACDINKGPLLKSQENIMLHNLTNTIETRLGNGLEPINVDEADCCVIAGMGGNLIVNILENEKDVVANFKQLVLQPQNDLSVVRRYLHKINLSIEDESFITDKGKHYCILSVIRGDDFLYNECFYEFGKINLETKNETLHVYLNIMLKKYTNILDTVSNKTDTSIKTLQTKINIIKESLNEYY